MNERIDGPLVAGNLVLPARRNRDFSLRLAVAVVGARLLTRLRPGALHRAMSMIARGAEPASYVEAEAAVVAVTGRSRSAAGKLGCLTRSIGACLLLRLKGKWPHWHVGVASTPPFRAHAWIQADERIVGELGDPDDYATLFSVVIDRTGTVVDSAP